MSTIEEVRAAEKRVQRAVDALKKADARDVNHISEELQKATDEYARLVRELKCNQARLPRVTRAARNILIRSGGTLGGGRSARDSTRANDGLARGELDMQWLAVLLRRLPFTISVSSCPQLADSCNADIAN